MANNRMCLRCVPCDKTFLLAKYYPTLTNGWFVPDYENDFVERMDEFLERHSFCDNNQGDWSFGNRRFDLTFEVPAPTQ